jgi:hypothetical protein
MIASVIFKAFSSYSTARKPSPSGLGGSAAPLIKIENKINIGHAVCL